MRTNLDGATYRVYEEHSAPVVRKIRKDSRGRLGFTAYGPDGSAVWRQVTTNAAGQPGFTDHQKGVRKTIESHGDKVGFHEYGSDADVFVRITPKQ